jgi:hypothetical protein
MPKIDSGYVKKELPGKIGTIGVLLLAIGLIFGIISYFVDPARAAFSYLNAFIFLVTISLGSLFLVALEYLANAVWSVPFRRVSEFLAASVPLLIFLVIPLFFSLHHLFIWTHPEAVAKSTVLQKKVPYLNASFFITRALIIFAIFWFFYAMLIRNSRKQDKLDDQSLTTKNIRWSGAFMPVFAFFISLIAFDWIMSMSPVWFSTIFGVYLFADAAWVALAFQTLYSVSLTENGYLSPKIKKDHYYSLGTLMFAFTVFWAYIAFSQYMLQWYGDLPEEIIFFVHRWNTEGLKVLSLVMIISHFFVPFLLLLPRSSKTNPSILRFVAVWIIVAEFIDIYWLIMPGMVNNGFQFSFSWIDFTFPIAVIGLVMFIFNLMAKRHNLIPVGDPKLKRGLDFRL